MLRIDSKYKDQIRVDASDPAKSSTASLVTQGLLGDRYVSITRGLSGSEIPPGGVVPGTEEAAMKQMVERGADLMENLGALTTDIHAIVAQVQKGQGTIGKLLRRSGALQPFECHRREVRRHGVEYSGMGRERSASSSRPMSFTPR